MNEEIIENESANTEESEPTEARVVHEIDSKYRLILLAAQRSKQLQRGANIRIDNMDLRKHKPTRVAMEEVKQKKVFFEFTEEI
jgi:DNA-directed RNA polymerase omega subunit